MSLTSEQLEQIHREGACHFPSFLSSDETAQLLSETEQIMGDESVRSKRDPEFYQRYQADTATYGNQHHRGPLMRSLAEGSRLQQIADSLWDCGAEFHLSLIQCSEAGQRQGQAWHRDVDPETWPNSLYNFLIYPEGVTEESGPLVFVPGSHGSGVIPPGDPYGYIEGQHTLIAEPGDLVIVNSCVFHSVPRNRSDRRRFSVNFRFRRADVPAAALTVGVYRNARFDFGTGREVPSASPGTAAAP